MLCGNNVRCMPRRVRARAVVVRYLFPQHDVADDDDAVGCVRGQAQEQD